MVYDWEHKEAECYRLYVEERKSLDDVMDHFKQKGFAPSKRAFQTQFKRWEFPSKQNPAHKNAPLVVRIKELWEKNTSQKDMLRRLHAEGFDIKERELMRVRAKNRWLLRVPNGMKGSPQDGPDANSTHTPMQELELEQAMLQQEEKQEMKPPPSSSSEVQRKRQERLARMQAESDERWAARKRRRRTRGWAGLPADPPGPPRFPSETTLDESKAFLSLNNNTYRQVRDQFQAICESENVTKKTVAGPEKWQKTKDRLIGENPHLQHIFWSDQTHKVEQKALALDVICTDVTKRMRTLERRMTIAEAKNVIAINPEESRQVRNAFYALLVSDEFTSKLETGDEHWNDLKARWIADSPILQRILAPGPADPSHAVKVRAIEVLCRDVMKRLRDDQAKKDPTRRRQFVGGPGPGPAPPRHAPPTTGVDVYSHVAPTAPMVASQPNGGTGATGNPNENNTHHPGNSTTPSTAAATATAAAAAVAVQQASDLQIDPSLLLAAANPAMTNGHPHGHNHGEPHGHLDPSANLHYNNLNGSLGGNLNTNLNPTLNGAANNPSLAHFNLGPNSLGMPNGMPNDLSSGGMPNGMSNGMANGMTNGMSGGMNGLSTHQHPHHPHPANPALPSLTSPSSASFAAAMTHPYHQLHPHDPTNRQPYPGLAHQQALAQQHHQQQQQHQQHQQQQQGQMPQHGGQMASQQMYQHQGQHPHPHPHPHSHPHPHAHPHHQQHQHQHQAHQGPHQGQAPGPGPHPHPHPHQHQHPHTHQHPHPHQGMAVGMGRQPSLHMGR